MKRIVRRPVCAPQPLGLGHDLADFLDAGQHGAERRRSARCVVSAMIRASVVLPVPGGPQRMIDCSRSRSMASRSGLPGASRSSCPTNSSNVRGRMRSASGAGAVAAGLRRRRLEQEHDDLISVLVRAGGALRRRAARRRPRRSATRRAPASESSPLVGRCDRVAASSPGPSPPRRTAIGAAQVDVEQRPPAARHRGDDAAAVPRAPRPRRSAVRPSRRSAGERRCPSIRAAPSSRTGRRTAPAATTPVAPAGFGDAHDGADVARDPGRRRRSTHQRRGAGVQTCDRRPAGRPRWRRSRSDDRTGLTRVHDRRRRRPRTSTPRALERGRSARESSGRSSAVGGDGCAARAADAGGQRLGDQVRAVEQEHGRRRLAAARRRDSAATTGLLAAA